MFILAKNSIRFLFLLLCIGNANHLAAQIKPPLTDLQFKFGWADFYLKGGTEETDYYCFGFSMGFDANFNINERVAIGSYFSRVSEQYSDDQLGNVDNRLFTYGIKMRLASGLRPVIRPYIEFTVGAVNYTEESPSSQYKFNGMTYGGSIGVMIKLNYHFYLVLAPLSMRIGSGSEIPIYMYEISGGLHFNVGKRK